MYSTMPYTTVNRQKYLATIKCIDLCNFEKNNQSNMTTGGSLIYNTCIFNSNNEMFC